MGYTRVGPFINNAAPYLSAATFNTFENGLVDITAHLLAGPGIDSTGVTSSTAAVQAFLDVVPDGSTVTVPNGAIIAFATGVTISKRIRLTGSGELRYIGGNLGSLITVNRDGVHLDGLYLTNGSGAQKTAVNVTANVFRATGNRLTGWRDGIQIAATGEFHDIVIANNQVLDIIGSGLGSGNNTYNGEDSGDGITCWGAAVTITGNRVTCKAGSDARIGIHVENLAQQELDTSYPNRDSLATITGNVISGQFRRGIVSEGVAHATIAGNSIADPTWWGIAIIGLAHYSIVTGNTIKWTRTAADTQGSGSAPVRSGIMLFCIQEPQNSIIVANNTVRAIAGSTITAGLTLQADSSVSSNAAIGLKVTGNQFVDESGTMPSGVNISAATTGTEIRENRVPSHGTQGVHVAQGNNVSISGNVTTGRGAGTSTYGIYLEGGAPDANVWGNRIEAVTTGISAQFRSGLLTINNNQVKTATTGVDCFSSTSAVGTAAGNAFSGVTTKTTNMPAGLVTTGANN